ncbi:MAG: hypothetical protein L6275_05815, partial [Candidatus Portnoybacteria bacterium]|nr:hypothetical protein [Candidatus Portnoybacteria bacterium]
FNQSGAAAGFATTTIVGDFTVQDADGAAHLYVQNNTGNLGIGTTTPDSKLTTIGRIHASSTTEQLRLSYDVESSKYASFTIDSNGDLNIDLAANNSTTTISDNLSVLGYLNVEGNATTTGSQYISKDLTVDGQCVTGDTLLPIIKSEEFSISNSQFSISEQIEYKQIKDVQSGDYVLSLNEKTGELTPAKIKQLMDMGVKTIYEIETEDGRTIRTTGNHPYLARQNLGDGGLAHYSSPREDDSTLSGRNITNLSLSLEDSNLINKEKDLINPLASFWEIFNQTTAKTFPAEYSAKSPSLVTKILSSFNDNLASFSSDKPLEANTASTPFALRNLYNS